MEPFIIQLTYLAALIFIVGIMGTLALFRFQYDDFLESGLALKIAVWIPLWILYIVAAYNYFTAFIFFIVALSLIEVFWTNKNAPLAPRLVYSALFTTGIGFFAVFVGQSSDPSAVALSLLAACALSDVVAFFAGRAFGYHALPVSVNPRKSWEGVFGQFVGGVAGIMCIGTLGVPGIPLGVALSVGFGSACGDLANSLFKRITKVDSWSAAIPGHGGVCDRFASIAGTGFFLLLVMLFHS